MIFDWYTDLHLDHCRKKVLADFLSAMSSSRADGILITGDISSSMRSIRYGNPVDELTPLSEHLQLLEANAPCPIYFVLGNHDFWTGNEVTCHGVRTGVRQLLSEMSSNNLIYLTGQRWGKIPGSDDHYIVGHDGWYDVKAGVGTKAPWYLNDWNYIPELRRCWTVQTMAEKCREWANRAAMAVKQGVAEACGDGAKHVLILTHVPPFESCHYHQGKPGDADAHPWFVSKVMGTTLCELATFYPKVRLEVLCGHTHGAYEGYPYDKLPNLYVRVGGAAYGAPKLAGQIELEYLGDE